MKMNNAVIILTKNEEVHLERCILNIPSLFNKIYVIDSFSSDRTKEIAKKFPVVFLENKFLNHSKQFNWALDHLDKKTDWVLRIDADEFLSKQLIEEMSCKIPKLDSCVKGIFLPRRIIFQNQLIRYGGINKTKVLRLFKYDYGKCDDRWMDEHIKVNGKTVNFENSIIDYNLKPISWWINKHNDYASREAFQIINDELCANEKKNNSYFKSHKKRSTYYKSPLFIRSFLYFVYRYFICFGFLDGFKGFSFHFLQAFWYRLLVDIKYLEVKNNISQSKLPSKKVIRNILHIDLHN